MSKAKRARKIMEDGAVYLGEIRGTAGLIIGEYERIMGRLFDTGEKVPASKGWLRGMRGRLSHCQP